MKTLTNEEIKAIRKDLGLNEDLRVKLNTVRRSYIGDYLEKNGYFTFTADWSSEEWDKQEREYENLISQVIR